MATHEKQSKSQEENIYILEKKLESIDKEFIEKCNQTFIKNVEEPRNSDASYIFIVILICYLISMIVWNFKLTNSSISLIDFKLVSKQWTRNFRNNFQHKNRPNFHV